MVQKSKSVANLEGHLTAEEREQREKAESRFRRDDGEGVLVQVPEYLEGDEVGKRTWLKILKDAENFGIFDDLDFDVLGTYCSITSRIVYLRNKYLAAIRGHRKNDEILEYSKELRMLEAQQLNFAGKMGLTPESRVRLAQKLVVEEEDATGGLYG